MAPVPNNDDAWARVAGQLQAHQSKYGGFDVTIPVFTLLGMQSAGKSRLLNVFAGEVVTGAIQDNTGTRCPCVFEFHNGPSRYCFGTDPRDMKEIPLDQLWIKVTEHMKQLGETPSRFSEVPLYLLICTPKALDVVVNDIPGLKPGVDPANDVIVPIIQGALAKPNTTPIIVTSIGDRSDLSYVTAELGGLKSACGIQEGVLANAIVLVSRLDMARNGFKGPAKLQNLRLEFQKMGLSKDPKNLIFLSLKPHLLEGSKENKVSDMDDQAKFDFQKENEYYATILAEEARKLPKFLEDHDVTLGGDLCFGICSAKDRMQNILVSSLRQNFHSVVREMTRRGNELVETANALLACDEVKKVRSLVQSYSRCLVTVISHVCNTNVSRIRSTLAAEQVLFPNHVRPPNIINVIESLRLRFSEEQSSVQKRCKRISSTLPLLSPSAIDAIDPRHQLRQLCEAPLSGGAALARLLKVWNCNVLKQPMKNYTTSDIINLNNMNDNNHVRALCFDAVLQKLVADLTSQSTMATSGLVDWAADLYIRQFDVVCDFFRESLQQLQAYPRLQAYIDTHLRAAFETIFLNAAVQAKAAIANVNGTRDSSLKLDMVFNLVRLMGCAQLPQTDNVTSTKPAENPDPISLLSNLLPKVGAIAGLLGNHNHDHDNMEFLIKPVCSVEDFAMCDTMVTIMLKGPEDVEKNVFDINRMAHGLTKVIIGLNSLDMMDLMEKHFSLLALDIERTMTRPVDDLLSDLLDHNCQKLASLLQEDKGDHVKRLESHANQLLEWVDVTTALNGVAQGPQMATITNVSKVQRLLARIEAEAQRTKAQLELPIQTPGDVDENTSEDDETAADISKKLSANFPAHHCIDPRRESHLLDHIAELEARLRGQGTGDFDVQRKYSHVLSENAALRQEVESLRQREAEWMRRVSESAEKDRDAEEENRGMVPPVAAPDPPVALTPMEPPSSKASGASDSTPIAPLRPPATVDEPTVPKWQGRGRKGRRTDN